MIELRLGLANPAWLCTDARECGHMRAGVAHRAGGGRGGAWPLSAHVYSPTCCEPLAVPLVYGPETVGHLLLAPRPGESGFAPADRRLLDELTAHAGVVVHAVRLTSDLQHARERLVTARNYVSDIFSKLQVADRVQAVLRARDAGLG